MPWISGRELADFRSCRRKWDFSSPNRRNLERAEAPRLLDVERAVKDALAIYYFPGMWDWPRSVVLPLVATGYDRSVREQRTGAENESPLSAEEQTAWDTAASAGRWVVDRYVSSAPGLDRFAPVLVEAEYSTQIPDPADPDRAMATSTGAPVSYLGRADVLVVDEYDAYWLVRHRLVDRWSAGYVLADDDVSRLGCWAWARYYLGMTITGTIDNELTTTGEAYPRSPTQPDQPPLVPQSEGSGGGRSIPQHRRMSARASEPAHVPRVDVQYAPGVRRVWIRRGSRELEAAARSLSHDAGQMLSVSPGVPPNPSADLCRRCPFLGPCIDLMDGRDPSALLATGYRAATSVDTGPRIGTTTWSTGRGAAPMRFGRRRN